MTNIAVIGGAGFVGSRLKDRFNLGKLNYTIYDINLLNSEEDVNYLDVEKVNSLDQLKDTDIIINLAAEHRDDVWPISRYDNVNVQGAMNLCEVARKFDIKKIIFTSSVAIYGFAPAETDETGEPKYFNDYGRTKYLAEQVFKEWQNESPGDRTLVIIRPTVIFGEGNRGNVYNLFNQIASRKFVMVGGGENIKSMAYVENIVAFLEFSLFFNAGLHIYNYIDKPDFNMNKLVSEVRKTLFNKNNVGLRIPSILGLFLGYIADIAAKLIRRPLPISSIRIKKFLATTQFSSSLNETGFKPPVSLEDGLARTLHYEFLEDNSIKRTFKTE